MKEAHRAWHAGASYWRVHKDVNSASIGIELDHPGHELGYREFSHAQIDALIPLLNRIVKHYDIPRANVVGHSDVAPARKVDPGELFPWDRLAVYGLCLPAPEKLQLGDPFDNDGAFYLALERFGYDITDGHKAVAAFQQAVRPWGLTRSKSCRAAPASRVCACSADAHRFRGAGGDVGVTLERALALAQQNGTPSLSAPHICTRILRTWRCC